MEMFGFDKDFISDLEVRCRSSSSISGTLIAFSELRLSGFGVLGVRNVLTELS